MNNKILGHSIEKYVGSEREAAMRMYSPAMFATSPADSVSEKYNFVDTMHIINILEKLGWCVSHVSSKKSQYGQHMVRLYHNDLQSKVQESDVMRPQVVFMNSHDGTMCAKFTMGMFRLVCTNGLIVGEDGNYDSFSLKHIHADLSTFIDLTQQLHTKYDRVFSNILDMQNRDLLLSEQIELAYKAISLRDDKYLLDDKQTIDYDKIDRLHNINSILRPKRKEDANPTLWNVFNILEEKIIKGEFYKYREYGKRNVQPKAITEARKNIDLNAKLWIESNKYLHYNTNSPQVENNIIL